MIIKFPTALYSRQIPQGTAPGNITWVISTDAPTQAVARYLKLPLAEEVRKRPAPIFSETERRAHEGDLIFTLLRGDQSLCGNGQKQFEIGQLIDFDITDEVTSLTVDQTPETIEIQHNNNLLDLESIGLTGDEIDQLITQATLQKRTFEDQLTTIKSQIGDVKNQISDNQRKINETNKVLDATRQLYGIQAGDVNFQNAIYQKLLGIQTQLIAQRDVLATQYQTLVDQSQTTYNSLLQVSELVH